MSSYFISEFDKDYDFQEPHFSICIFQSLILIFKVRILKKNSIFYRVSKIFIQSVLKWSFLYIRFAYFFIRYKII